MKLKFVTGFLIIASLFLGSSHARDLSLNQLMAQVGNEMTTLFPLIYAHRELTANEISDIESRLDRMSTLFDQAGPLIDNRSPAYGISYQYIKPYLREIIDAFKAKKIDYARSRMYGISAICTSCHTQDTHLRTMFGGAKRKAFDSDYTYAEFNYLTRNYHDAELYFDKYLKNKEHKTELQIIKPIQRLITIYTQVYNRPGDGAKRISKYKNLSGQTKHTKKALTGWVSGLIALDASGAKLVNKPDFKTLESYVRKYLGKLDYPLSELYLDEDEQISRVWLRGQLYHYLNRNPKAEEIPKIIFWLSICDRSTDDNFYFSLADLYLKDCVKNYSSHPYANKCYSEYKEFVTSAYSGSGGIFIPIEIEDELFEMKQMLNEQE